ncbi:hypothetical protein H4582DRAFT_2068517 [Lactarius indigo]|nr:hypothetical protein H4582DRAFT_2068517 [Lactarius indigo]
MPYPTDGAHQEPAGLHFNSNCVTCPNVHDTLIERVRSESPDPLLLAPDKQLPQRYSSTQRRSIHPVDVPMPLRRSSHLENRRRVREGAEPYTQSQVRRSSLRTPGDALRQSYRRASSQHNRRSSRRSNENEGVFPEQNRSPERFRRASLQSHVLEHMVPVEDMEMIEGFQPFTELDPGQQIEPMTLREPVTNPPRGPFQYVWEPSVTFPEVGGMRVRVGQFERTEYCAEDATPLAWSDGNESTSSGSSSEGYFTAQDWTPSYIPDTNPLPSQPQPDFIQGSSKSVLPSQTCAGGDTYPPFIANEDVEFLQLEALAQHYAACTRDEPVRNSPYARIMSADRSQALPRSPRCPPPQPRKTPQYPQISKLEAEVDEREDWANARAVGTPTADIPAAALGVLSADLHLQKMLIDNEHWLLVGPRGVDLHEFGVRFQTRARTPDKFVFRFGNLNWGADVNQIEDEVCKATIESSMRGRGRPAMLPAQFMAGAVGGLVVWYALSLM